MNRAIADVSACVYLGLATFLVDEFFYLFNAPVAGWLTGLPNVLAIAFAEGNRTSAALVALLSIGQATAVFELARLLSLKTFPRGWRPRR